MNGNDSLTFIAFIAIPIAETLIALVAFYFFKRGKWKEIQV